MARKSVQVKLADAIAAQINAADAADFTISPNPTAVRSWAEWDEKLENLNTLYVDVVPAGISSELNDRGELVYTLETDIGVRKRFGQTDQASATGRINASALDELALLTEELHEFFAADRPTTEQQAVWTEVEYRAPYVRKHLRELRQWTSIVRVTHDWTKPIRAE